MSVTSACDNTLFDTYGRSPYVYIIDGDSTIDDLPTKTNPKGFHCAISGEVAIASDNTMYMFFIEDGWKEIESGGATPTGNINITDTSVIDVTDYATAQVVDGNLIAGNIKKDVDILGVTGTYEGSGGGGAQQQRDVNFIDYDGTIIHSYTAAEFAALTAMPDNPDHSSDIQWGGHTIPLTSEGWNWSLADAKAYVTKYGKLWIGQMYKPTDDKLHLCVRMDEGRLNPASQFTFTGTATIDWGDGTEPVAAVNNEDNVHTYAAAGDYDVAISVSEGGTLGFFEEYVSFSMLFHKQYTEAFEDVENFVYGNSIKYVFIPYSVTSIGPAALSECHSLQSVTIPDSVTSFGESSFAGCRSLQSITLPDSVTSIEGGVFFNCISLQRVAISNSVVSINDEAFSECYSLLSVTIPDSVTSFGESVFYDCYSLKNVTISDSVTSIEYGVFLNCNSMQNVTIPDNVTNIGEYAFQTCSSMTNIVIPESVISIGNCAFLRCFGLGFIRFESATPPTVSGSNTWEFIPTDCKIYVPSTSLEAYKTATNYPDPEIYTYIGY